jgi:acetylornithine deacetylase/succinyl-diaminopimelate desuccinylase-like protein
VGESEEDVLAPIRETIDRVRHEHSGLKASVKLAEETIQTYTGVNLTHKKFAPGWEIAAEHLLVQQAYCAVESCGLPVRIGHYDFCTDGSYSAGVAGIPTIGFGPSKETQAHVIDEYIEVAELSAAVKVYQSLVRTLLSQK